MYLETFLVGMACGDTAGNYETTIEVPPQPTGRRIIHIALPGPIFGRPLGYGVVDVEPRPCPGDRNGDGAVVVSELVTGVGLALGGAVDLCRALDADQSGSVGIEEPVEATTALLDGCP